MKFSEIALESIKLDDQVCRISESLESAALTASLREVGQLNPVVLFSAGVEPGTVICGFRRLHSLRRLGKKSALVRFLSPCELSPLQAFRMALWDNLSHRNLNALEKARVLHSLKFHFGVEQDALMAEYFPLLDLAPRKQTLRTYLALCSLHSDLKCLLMEGKLTLGSAERLVELSNADQECFAAVFGKSRWSSSLQRQLLDLVQELAVMGGCGASEVLGSSEITRVLDDSRQSPFQRGEGIYEILYRRAHPRLTRAKHMFLGEKKKLGLPGSVRISPEPFFETSCLRVEFDVQSAESFREIAAALQRAAHEPAMENLFRLS